MIKPYVGKQTRGKLGEFEYFNGWYGDSPVSKVILGNSFKHKKNLFLILFIKKIKKFSLIFYNIHEMYFPINIS